MRLRALLFALIALAGVGAAAYRIGAAAAAYVERATAAQVTEDLAAAGEDWARVEADGLIVTLTGAAPDEGRRLRAAEILRRVVDPARVRDETTLAASEPLAPPPFALEILRNDAEISLIGLAPEDAGRTTIADALAAAGLAGAVNNMLESVAQPAPQGWEAALDFGLAALGDLPTAKISVAPGRVAITALADDTIERRAIEARLRAGRPEGVDLALDVTAPLPVIAPFQVDFALTGGTSRLVACAAETDADAAIIAAAAGLPATDCMLGLGAPSAEWAAAAAAGIAAVRGLGGGRFTLADLEATFIPPRGAAPGRLATAAERLAAALPSAVALEVRAGPTVPPAGTKAGVTPQPPRFGAMIDPDGKVLLSGVVADDATRAAIESYAAALFGADRVEDTTVVAGGLPEGWPGRVLTGVEALALLKEGRVEVTAERVSLDGWAEDADGEAKAAALFASEDRGAVEIVVRFDAAAAAETAAAHAAVEDPAGVCATAIAAIEAREAIAFEPGSATLEPSAGPVIAALAAAFAACPPVDFEIAGHTDSQGAPERNQALSEERAAAVKAALEATDLPRIGFVARGYGAARPIADNDTADGRARNRRIAFTLIRPFDAAADDPTPETAHGPR